jgi:simple sugar transport system permease protein
MSERPAPQQAGEPEPAGGSARPRTLLRRAWSLIVLPLVSIGLAAIAGAVVIVVSELFTGGGFQPGLVLEAYGALINGSIGSPQAIVNTIVTATPLVLGGLSVALAFKAGLFNIGAQGQFIMGALAAVAVGVTVAEQPPIVAIPVAMLAAVLAGAFWGFIPGFLKAYTGAHEVVVTIMLNLVAMGVLTYMVSGPLDVPGSPQAITADVGNAALPILVGSNGHLGIIVALAAVGIVQWLLTRTTLGFEIRTVGANPDAARYAGMRPRRLIILTMSIAGILAGLAGAGHLLGSTHRMTPFFGTTVGFDSIAVALLARTNPVGVIFSALLFGGMRTGAVAMELQVGIPAELVEVLQALILLALVAAPVLRRVLRLGEVGGGIEGPQTITATYGGQATAR